MYLADSSAWIDFAGPRPQAVGVRLRKLIESGEPVFLTGVIYQEVLQGARDEVRFRRHREWLLAQAFVHPSHPVETYDAAARLYAQCRWQGLTVRKSTACLIASIAIEHNLSLLHDDRDFEKIATIEPRLKLA